MSVWILHVALLIVIRFCLAFFDYGRYEMQKYVGMGNCTYFAMKWCKCFLKSYPGGTLKRWGICISYFLRLPVAKF